MVAIVFAALDWSPDTQGSAAATLPALRARASEQTDVALGELAALTGSATGTDHRSALVSTSLPRLQARAFDHANAVLGTLPALTSFAAESSPTPEFGSSAASLPALQAVGAGVSSTLGSVSLTLVPLQVRALEAAGDYASGSLPALRGAALESVLPATNRMLLEQGAGFVYAYASNPVAPEDHAEAVATADSARVALAAAASEATTHSAAATFQHAANVIEQVVLAAEARSIAQLVEHLHEGAVFADLATLVFRVLATEAVTFADDAQAYRRQVEALVEVLVATAAAESKLAAVQLLAEAFALDALATRGFDESHVESATFADALVHSMRAYEAMLEPLVLDDVATSGVRFTVLCEEGFTLADSAVTQARFFEALSEGVTFTARFAFGGSEYVAWVINANDGGATRYSNFGFNSLAPFTIGGVERYFGAMDDGVYELDGADDAGAPINALVRSGLTDFGTREMKRLPTGYLLYTASGAMVVKIIATSPAGAKEAHYYQLEGRTAQATREDRVTPDRGIESVLWGWTLLNPNGEDFSVDAVAFFPLAINRRV